MLRSLVPCLGRGSVCALASLYASHDKSSDLEKKQDTDFVSKLRIKNALPYFLYGFITYPIILFNFRFVKSTFIPYIQKTTFFKQAPFFQGACMNELVLWPLNTYPFLCIFTTAKYSDIIPVTLYSSLFWVPFSFFQAKYSTLSFFAPIRLSGNFIYYVLLFKFCDKQSKNIK